MPSQAHDEILAAVFLPWDLGHFNAFLLEPGIQYCYMKFAVDPWKFLTQVTAGKDQDILLGLISEIENKVGRGSPSYINHWRKRRNIGSNEPRGPNRHKSKEAENPRGF